MKYSKYWGGRLRLLGDAIAATIAAMSLASTGILEGRLVIENLPLMFVGLAFALAVWFVGSYISKEMEGDE